MFPPAPQPAAKTFYTAWSYPGGERGVRIDPATAPGQFTFRIQSDTDLVTFLMLLDCYRQADRYLLDITIPYLPYARQDRVAVPGDPNAVGLIGQFLGTLDKRDAKPSLIARVVVLDCHSEAALEAIRKYVPDTVSLTNHCYITRFMRRIGVPVESTQLVIPDKGAAKKLPALREYMNREFFTPPGYVVCDKQRDPETGKLTGFNIVTADQIVMDGHFIIVDDICDGGGTFLGVADAILKSYPDAQLHLFTTHGIYSKGLQPLFAKFNTIGCTDSFTNHIPTHNRFIIIPTEF